MEPAEYEIMYHHEDTYWWFQGRNRVVRALLESLPCWSADFARVLDLGCGTGLLLQLLRERHWSVGLDFSPLALDFTRRRGAGPLVRGDVEKLPVDSESFDLVTALDLAEHIPSDSAFFSEVWRVLKPAGSAVLTVPVHPWLWSEHDEALHHQRRYTRNAFRQTVLAAGFEIERLTYCITLTYPFIVGFRLLQKMLPEKPREAKTHLIELPSWANSLLIQSVALEARLVRKMDLPFGVTLAAVLRKKSH